MFEKKTSKFNDYNSKLLFIGRLLHIVRVWYCDDFVEFMVTPQFFLFIFIVSRTHSNLQGQLL